MIRPYDVHNIDKHYCYAVFEVRTSHSLTALSLLQLLFTSQSSLDLDYIVILTAYLLLCCFLLSDIKDSIQIIEMVTIRFYRRSKSKFWCRHFYLLNLHYRNKFEMWIKPGSIFEPVQSHYMVH